MYTNLSKIENNILAGHCAHKEMCPQSRNKFIQIKIPANAKHSSILILLYQKDKEIRTVFIKRTASKSVHSRQISFPGGAMEPKDKDYATTAIRECREEIGVNKQIKIIRKLSDLYVPPSNFIVHPFVGFIKDIGEFKANKSEVDLIFTESINHFLFEQNKDIYYYFNKGKASHAPCFISNGYAIWGATAMILNELLHLISKK